MNNKPLKLKKFRNEDEERKFWGKVDLSKHYSKEDFSPVVFPNLKPSSQPVSLRIPAHILARLKEQANELHVPYQSLMKQYISQGIAHGQKRNRVHITK